MRRRLDGAPCLAAGAGLDQRHAASDDLDVIPLQADDGPARLAVPVQPPRPFELRALPPDAVGARDEAVAGEAKAGPAVPAAVLRRVSHDSSPRVLAHPERA